MTFQEHYPITPGAQPRETSHAAAGHAARTAPRLRALALAAVRGSQGLTADEVARQLGLSILSIRPRLTELARLGKVRDSGLRRRNISGRNAIVWEPTRG